MKEKDFYDVLDTAEDKDTKNLTNGRYVTVEDFEAHNVSKNPEKWVHILAYYANDPLKETPAADEPEYKKVVDYAAHLVSEVNIS